MKALAQLLGAMVAAVGPLLVGNQLSLTEWINVGVVAAGAATVYIAANLEDEGVWAYTKLFMSLISAGGVVAISALGDGVITQVEVMQILAALVAAVAVWRVPGPVSVGRHARLED